MKYKKMKNVILFCTIILLSACNEPEKMKTSEVKMDLISINDSIIQLISTFQQDQDSTALELALCLNDQAIALDSLNDNQFYNLNTRIQILGLLDRKKEAFLLKNMILSKDEANIDRLIYYGQKYKLKGQIDSSQIYFNKALIRCNELLADTLSSDLIMKKAEIYIYQKKNKEALNIIDQSLLKNPQDINLKSFRGNFDEYCKIINDLFEDIKL